MTDDHLRFDSFIFDLKADTREQVLQNIAWRLGRETEADMTWIADQLLHFEARDTSGIGGGVAIPHLKSTPLTKPYMVLARLGTPVDFAALDDQKVDIVCALFSPQLDNVAHLRRLSRVTRLFRESFVLEKLRAATNEADMAALFDFPARQVMAA